MRVTKRQLRSIIKEQILQEKMGTDVYKVVMRTLSKQGPKTHQELLATLLSDYPGASDEELDRYIDSFEESGDIIYDRRSQKYRQVNNMKITKRQLKRIIKEEKAKSIKESRYMSSHEEKALPSQNADSILLDLESLLDMNYHIFTDAESSILEQALEIMNKLRGQ